jgi:hypothetical protein
MDRTEGRPASALRRQATVAAGEATSSAGPHAGEAVFVSCYGGGCAGLRSGRGHNDRIDRIENVGLACFPTALPADGLSVPVSGIVLSAVYRLSVLAWPARACRNWWRRGDA